MRLLILINFKGACLFRILDSVDENSSTYELSEVGVTVCKSDARMSLEKFVILMDLKDLINLVVWEGLVWEGTLRLKVMAWWSEMQGSNSEILEIILDSDLAISRSRVCPLVCVGKLMCWERLYVSSKVRKGAELGKVGVSTWILKSPKKMISEGWEIISSSTVENSVRKGALEEDGGRLIV